MGKLFKEMFHSKKFIAALIGGVAALVGHFAPELREPTHQFLLAVAAYIIGQGLADFGKEAKKIEKQ